MIGAKSSTRLFCWRPAAATGAGPYRAGRILIAMSQMTISICHIQGLKGANGKTPTVAIGRHSMMRGVYCSDRRFAPPATSRDQPNSAVLRASVAEPWLDIDRFVSEL